MFAVSDVLLDTSSVHHSLFLTGAGTAFGLFLISCPEFTITTLGLRHDWASNTRNMASSLTSIQHLACNYDLEVKLPCRENFFCGIIQDGFSRVLQCVHNLLPSSSVHKAFI